jgi:hypothetical protein
MSFEHLKPVQNIIHPQPNKPKIDSIVFGFGFRARSGKDTAVAEIIKQRDIRPVAHLPIQQRLALGRSTGVVEAGIKRYAFADELKREVTQAAESAGGMERLFDPMEFIQENGNAVVLPHWVTYDPNPDMSDPLCPFGKQRLLLQWYGTEFRRHVNADYWVNRLAQRIAEDKPKVALITDMRFPNEKAFVEKYGQSVRVDRPDLPPLRGAAGVHPSELALADVPDWDWGMILRNDSTLEQFLLKSVEAFDELMMLQAAS